MANKVAFWIGFVAFLLGMIFLMMGGVIPPKNDDEGRVSLWLSTAFLFTVGFTMMNIGGTDNINGYKRLDDGTCVEVDDCEINSGDTLKSQTNVCYSSLFGCTTPDNIGDNYAVSQSDYLEDGYVWPACDTPQYCLKSASNCSLTESACTDKQYAAQ